MEVQRKKPPTVKVSPGKAKKEKEVTPVKRVVKKLVSSEKAKHDKEDVSVFYKD